MVKMTIIGRASDGLPLAQGPRYVNEEDENCSSYKQQAEFILKEISRSGPLVPPKMTVRVDRHCFKRLAFHYLQDLHKEMEKFDSSFINKISKPYSFVKFDGTISIIRKQYTDTRTQLNLSRLNANRRHVLDILTQDMSSIVEKRRRLDMLDKATKNTRNVSPIWCSPQLEVIALKWTPITLVVIVVTVLLWNSLLLSDDFTVMAF